jgi:hypothetical protein
VTVTGQSAECNGTGTAVFVTDLTVVGRSTTNGVVITSSSLDLTFARVTLDLDLSVAVQVVASSVRVVASGANVLSAVASGQPAIECSSGSNLTLAGSAAGGGIAVQGSTAGGIGAGSPGRCGAVEIVNGSVDVRGGTGIGAGGTVDEPRESAVERISILGGSIRASGTAGAGIGTGDISGGISAIAAIEIRGGDITAQSTSLGAAGIGSGAAVTGSSSIGSIVIYNGNITGCSTATYGAGIGTGYGSDGGNSTIGRVSIVGGHITATSNRSELGMLTTGDCQGSDTWG